MQAVSKNDDGLYFLDALGGTDKTYIILLILATIRSEQKIALAFASWEISAAFLMVRPQTLH